MKSKYQIRYQHTAWSAAASKGGALRSVRSEAGTKRIHRAEVPDGIYCYKSRAEKNADSTGAMAFAVICGPGQQGERETQ